MPAFVERYTQAQRDALAFAYEDRRIRPAGRVVELAAAGELVGPDGATLDRFETNINAVRDFARKLRRRRAGEVKSQLAAQPPRDAIETLRRRLVNVADAELQEEEKKRPGARDPERLRQLARVLIEAARIPGPTDPRPPSPATRDENGKQHGGRAMGPGGKLMQAHRATQGGTTAQDAPHHHTHGEGEASDTPHDTTEQDSAGSDEPGVYVRERVAALGAGLVSG